MASYPEYTHHEQASGNASHQYPSPPPYDDSDEVRPATPTDEEVLSQALEFVHHVPPPNYTPLRLPKPVTIPQSMAGIGQPFARVYAPGLASYNITESDFVEFIDNLNIVATANPQLQAVNLVGGVIGMVPHHIFSLAGTGIQAISKIGTAVVSKTRTERYMENVNSQFFAPRGLRASITNMEALATVLGIPLDSPGLAPITEANMDLTVLQRRMQGIQPYTMNVTFNVPPPAPQTDTLAKISAAQVKRQAAKNDAKAIKQRRREIERMEKHAGEGEKSQKGEKKVREVEKELEETQSRREELEVRGDRGNDKSERKLEKELSKLEEKEEKQLRELEKEVIKLEEKRAKSERKADHKGRDKEKKEKESKEVKQAKKALWILIENA